MRHMGRVQRDSLERVEEAEGTAGHREDDSQDSKGPEEWARSRCKQEARAVAGLPVAHDGVAVGRRGHFGRTQAEGVDSHTGTERAGELLEQADCEFLDRLHGQDEGRRLLFVSHRGCRLEC